MRTLWTGTSIAIVAMLVLAACAPSATPAPAAPAPQQDSPVPTAEKETAAAVTQETTASVGPASVFDTYPLPTSCDWCSQALEQLDKERAIRYAFLNGDTGVVVAPLKEPLAISSGYRIVGAAWSPLMQENGIFGSVFVLIAPWSMMGFLAGEDSDGGLVEYPLSLFFQQVMPTYDNPPLIDTAIRGGGVVFTVAEDNATYSRYWSYDYDPNQYSGSRLLSPAANGPTQYGELVAAITETVGTLQETNPPLPPEEIDWPGPNPPCVLTNTVAIDYYNVIGEVENPTSNAECKPAEGGNACKADIVVAAVAPPQTENGQTPTHMCLGESDSWINLSVLRVEKDLDLGINIVTLPKGSYVVRAKTDNTGQIAGLGLQEDGSYYQLGAVPTVVVDGVSESSGRLSEPVQIPATFAAYLNSAGDQGIVEISACKIFSCCLFHERCGHW